jgi:uncharacterized OB-fold protein
LPGFAGFTPYAVAVVALLDPSGIRMLGRVVDTDLAAMAVGDQMEVHFEQVQPGIVLPLWRRQT